MTAAGLFRTILFLMLALTAGCQSLMAPAKPVLEDEGEVCVYVQPFAQEADRLLFSLAGITAVRDDGMEFPLGLLVRDFSRAAMGRQRLVAAGRLPEGTYTGLRFQALKATLKSDEGEAALSVPEAPVKRDFPFKVERKKSLVLWLSLQYADAVTGGSQFKPVWFVSIPSRPLTGLSGYISSAGHDAITVFDKRNEAATGIMAAPGGPRGMVLDKSRNRLYAALSRDDAVEVIDITEGRSVGMIRLVQGDAPGELALTPDGSTLLSVNGGSDSLSFIDTSALVELARIDVGKRPRALVVEKTGRKAYVFNTLSNSISVVDIAGKAVMGSIATGTEPVRGQFNRQGDRLYVAHAEYPYLFIIDPMSFSVLRKEFVGAGIRSLKVDTRTDLLYLGKKNDAAIAVYDPFTLNAVEYIPTAGPVEYMTIDGEGNNLYMVIGEKKRVAIMNLINTRSVVELEVPDNPSWVTMMGER